MLKKSQLWEDSYNKWSGKGDSVPCTYAPPPALWLAPWGPTAAAVTGPHPGHSVQPADPGWQTGSGAVSTAPTGFLGNACTW